MKKSLVYLSVFIVLVLIGSQAFSLVQLYIVKKGIKGVSEELSIHSEQTNDNEIKILTKQNELSEGIGKANEKIASVAENQDVYASRTEENFTEIKASIDIQLNETKKTRKTYEAVLEEQKKRTVDTASKDDFLKTKKNEGAAFYGRKDFVNAYKVYDEILIYQEDDLDMRFLRMTSLYYSNPSDSRNYRTVLEECSILRANGYANSEIEKIEKSVKSEMGETNE